MQVYVHAVEHRCDMMAHEMSHVILRHGTNQVSKAEILELPSWHHKLRAGPYSVSCFRPESDLDTTQFC